jgi:hypothetical protein
MLADFKENQLPLETDLNKIKMKNPTLILLLVLMLMAPSIEAQKPVKVLEDSILIGNYLYPGFNVTIPEANFENTLKNWIKLQETGSKSKVQTENGEMTIFGANIKQAPPLLSTSTAGYGMKTLWPGCW